MTEQTFSPGPTPDTVTHPDGRVLAPPPSWCLLRPGDAALTRRVKAKGEFWLIQEKKGRKVFSRGVWAPSDLIRRIREDLLVERGTESYAKKLAASARRREKLQAEYVEDFEASVVAFLDFDAHYLEMSKTLAKLVTDLATPVGSGTVARTKRVSVEKRAEAAVIAWLRHQTTGYDDMVIPRVKGKRKEVRRMLARRSKRLLGQYQRGEDVTAGCPLLVALQRHSP